MPPSRPPFNTPQQQQQVGKTLAELQVADLIAVGRVLLCLITSNSTACDSPTSLRSSLAVAHTTCSKDLVDALRYMTAVDADSAARLPTVHGVVSMIGGRILKETENCHHHW